MRKTLLVALRELLENVRTKTFWIGIVSVPILLAVMAAVPILLERAREARTYAVLDQSGWLLPALEARIAAEDGEAALRWLRTRPADSEAVDALPASVRSLAEAAQGLPADAVPPLAHALAGLEPPPGSPPLPDGVAQAAASAGAGFRQWLRTLSPGQARDVAPGMSRARFLRVEVPTDASDPEAWLRGRLESREEPLFAYVVIGPDPLAGSDGNKYVSGNATDTDLKEWLTRLAGEEVEARRFARYGIDPDVASRIQEPVAFEERTVGAGGEEREVGVQERLRQWAPVGFVYVLWIAVFTSANMLLTNTIEEKSNRIIEVLLSSLSPLQLMVGKVLGIAATGLLVVGSWALFALVGVNALSALVAGGGGSGIDFAAVLAQPRFLGSFVAYFVMGYLLYASFLVGVGSTCNSLKEAQNIVGPVMILLFLPLAAMVPVSRDPNGLLAKVLSFVPPFTPFVMMNRAAGPPAAWEYAATTALLLAFIALTFWLAAKVFRVGILMTGKPPRLREILRFLREPVGITPGKE